LFFLLTCAKQGARLPLDNPLTRTGGNGLVIPRNPGIIKRLCIYFTYIRELFVYLCIFSSLPEKPMLRMGEKAKAYLFS
jgi:hypothetical protein